MPEHDAIDVVCDDCECVPRLVEVPYNDTGNYMVVCDCELRGIAVDDCVNSSALLKPISGKWSNLDASDNPNR